MKMIQRMARRLPINQSIKQSINLSNSRSISSIVRTVVLTRRYVHTSSTNQSINPPNNQSTIPPHGLSHVDSSNSPTMVDVGSKAITSRIATARSVILLPPNVAAIISNNPFDSLSSNQSIDQSINQSIKQSTRAEILGSKGPVLATAIIAGTMAVKQTHSLIPFCHPLMIEKIKFYTNIHQASRPSESDISIHQTMIKRYNLTSDWAVLTIECTVSCTGKTGVEMEALTGCSVAALTVYDMLKALSHDIMIAETQLVSKEGGKTGSIKRKLV